MKTILITGGSGFIGTKLTEVLLQKGYSVVIVDLNAPRIQNDKLSFEKLDISKDTLPKKYDGVVGAIVHLAGKNIFGRWTENFKKEVYDSRIESTKNIITSIVSWGVKPEVLVSASAFGFYGDKGEIEVMEDTSVGSDFLALVCKDWEGEALKAESVGVRTVQIRTAHVLGNGGLLAPLFVPFKFGLGAWLGSGESWLPWVHVKDIVDIYTFAIENKNIRGPINTAAPDVYKQKNFMKEFGKVLGKKVLFSIPIFILKIQYGGLADTFENSVRMSSLKLNKYGFSHTFPDLKTALLDVVSSKK